MNTNSCTKKESTKGIWKQEFGIYKGLEVYLRKTNASYAYKKKVPSIAYNLLLKYLN
jgi:hypothetical protein